MAYPEKFVLDLMPGDSPTISAMRSVVHEAILKYLEQATLSPEALAQFMYDKERSEEHCDDVDTFRSYITLAEALLHRYRVTPR